MKKIKVMSVFGTRPEAVKMCPLVRELQKHEEIENIVCLTAQHREMLDQATKFFGIKADLDLDIMKPSQTFTSITTEILQKMDEVFSMFVPDIVLVHGDTTTSFAAALAAFYKQIPVGHVEAGLRSFDKYSPYPEEMNRRLTGKLADLHFAPTENNRKNLTDEGINENIYVTGNTVIDSFAYTISEDYKFEDKTLAEINFDENPNMRYITLTAHRRENQGEGLINICNAVLRLVEKFDDITVIDPVHLSPAVRNTVIPMLGGHDRIILCDPANLPDMHNLIARSYCVLTDSGGIQEEAPSLGVPVLVLRTETERPEAVDAGTVKVIGIDEDVIFNEASELLTNPDTYKKMSEAVNPYGDGHASERIAEIIIKYFSEI